MDPFNSLLHASSLGLRMLQGAGIGFMLILLFLVMADGARPEWGTFWMLRPLFVVTFAGAMGGAFYTFLDPWRRKGRFQRILANLISAMVFVFGIWIGSILGLDGTYWD
ncbi:MAG: potassium transporter KefB [Bacteroidetes bacterium]|nr:MAG: potassium transporter KefB [Bacteroidota bacterium]